MKKFFYKDGKVITTVNILTYHKIFVNDLEITKERRKRGVDNQLRIRCGSLTIANAFKKGRNL